MTRSSPGIEPRFFAWESKFLPRDHAPSWFHRGEFDRVVMHYMYDGAIPSARSQRVYITYCTETTHAQRKDYTVLRGGDFMSDGLL